MNRRYLFVIGALAIILGSVFIITDPLAISGYDGINSSIYRVLHSYQDVEMTPTGMTSLTLDPDPLLGGIGPDPTAIRIDMQIPNVDTYRDLDDIEQNEETVETIDGEIVTTTTTKIWKVRIVTMNFAVHIKTAPQGLAAIEDVSVFIRLQENGDSVFSDPDESEAYILNVYTIEETEVFRDCRVGPLAGGIDLTMITIKTGNVPSWITDSGYTGALRNLKDVAIILEIHRMAPESLFVRGAEAEAIWHLGFDVILFGFWEETKTTREFEREPPKYPWELFLIALGDFAEALPELITTVVGMVMVMIAIIGTVIIVVRVPNPWLKLFGVVAVWVAVLFILAVFGAGLLANVVTT